MWMLAEWFFWFCFFFFLFLDSYLIKFSFWPESLRFGEVFPTNAMATRRSETDMRRKCPILRGEGVGKLSV